MTMPRSRLRFVAIVPTLLAAASLLWLDPAHATDRKVFRYSYEVAETGFDPVQLSDLYSRNMTVNVFDAPYRFAYLATPGTVEPNTAVDMPTVSADFKHYTIRIKPGIYFTDDPVFKGKRRELTAADYVYSWKRFYDPRWKSPNLGSWEIYEVSGMDALRQAAIKTGKFDYDRDVPGLRVVDRYTFEMRFDKPQPRFVQDMADASILGAVAREVVEAYGDGIMEHPVGTGAYKLAEWRRTSFMAFERNPDYRDEYLDVTPDPTDPEAQRIAAQLKGVKLPLLDRIEVSIIQESQPRWLAFLNAEQDYLERVPFDLAPLAYVDGGPTPTLKTRGVTVQRRPIIDITLVLYNMENPTVGGYTPEKVALRRAVNLALDSSEIARSVFKGQAMVAQSLIMPMTYGFDPDLRTELGVTDVARANALLDAYGYVDRDGDGWRDMPDGSPLVLDYSTQPDQRSRIQDEVWKKSMDRIRVKLTFNVAQWPEQLRKTRNGQYMVWMLGLSASQPDSGSTFGRAYGPSVGAENMARFRNATYDKLFDEQNAMPDGPERIAKMREMQKILISYAPMKYPLHRFALYMTYPWVKNYRSWPFTVDWWKYLDVDTEQRAKAGK
ncbi:ABC transporter substrate-binding protein [soil metagenome]